MNVIPLRPAPARRKPRAKRQQIDILAELRWLLKTARPMARSVYLNGIKYPIRRGLAIDAVLCPVTSRPLVARVAL